MENNALINFKNGFCYVISVKDKDSIASVIYDVMGDDSAEESTGVPTYIEASNWCSLASIGDTFERSKFKIAIIEN